MQSTYFSVTWSIPRLEWFKCVHLTATFLARRPYLMFVGLGGIARVAGGIGSVFRVGCW